MSVEEKIEKLTDAMLKINNALLSAGGDKEVLMQAQALLEEIKSSEKE